LGFQKNDFVIETNNIAGNDKNKVIQANQFYEENKN
jgi:hypothetical protein